MESRLQGYRKRTNPFRRYSKFSRTSQPSRFETSSSARRMGILPEYRWFFRLDPSKVTLLRRFADDHSKQDFRLLPPLSLHDWEDPNNINTFNTWRTNIIDKNFSIGKLEAFITQPEKDELLYINSWVDFSQNTPHFLKIWRIWKFFLMMAFLVPGILEETES